MNTDNKTLTEKAIEWWGGIPEKEAAVYRMEYFKLRGFLTDNQIVIVYLSEHPEENETKEQTKGVIEGLDFKSIEPIAEQFRINAGFTDDANISFCSGFDKGQIWFNNTHYTPLLELCGELNKALEAAKDCMMEESPSDEILEKHGCDNYGWINLTVNRAIEKANNYLKQ